MTEQNKSIFTGTFFKYFIFTALLVSIAPVVGAFVQVVGFFTGLVAWVIAVIVGFLFIRGGEREKGAGVLAGLSLGIVIFGISCFAIIAQI